MDLEKWIKYCDALRNNVVKKEGGAQKYLLANFKETRKDTTKMFQILGEYFRVKLNAVAFEKLENNTPIDFSDNSQVFKALAKEFDMPYWGFMALKNRPLKDFSRAFIYQTKACNLRCLWCYANDINKNGRNEHAKYFSIPEIFDVFEETKKTQTVNNFRPSGGEPTLAVEQWLESLREAEKRKLNVFVQGDTNLTTGHYIDYLGNTGEIEKNLLEKVAEYDNFGLLCSFKGTHTESFLRAVNMPKCYSFLEDERWYSFAKLTKAGIDTYPFIYDPDPRTLESFMEKGARKFGDGFYLKTWIFRLKKYEDSGKERIEKTGVGFDDFYKRLDDNFAESKEIMQNLIQKKYGLNYQAVPRFGIKLKVHFTA
jgi:uncharacterized Fe-S cluster-containing radical SAM superfamily protein